MKVDTFIYDMKQLIMGKTRMHTMIHILIHGGRILDGECILLDYFIWKDDVIILNARIHKGDSLLLRAIF